MVMKLRLSEIKSFLKVIQLVHGRAEVLTWFSDAITIRIFKCHADIIGLNFFFFEHCHVTEVKIVVFLAEQPVGYESGITDSEESLTQFHTMCE